MNGNSQRLAQAYSSLLVVLFLLSCLLVVPALRWAFVQSQQTSVPDEYRFRDSTKDVERDSKPSPAIRAWHYVEPFEKELAQFETVFWEPDDTTSLRNWIVESEQISGSEILEIGTGTGLVALLCAQRGAAVVALDINPNAVANVAYNALHLELASAISPQQVPTSTPNPFTVLEPHQKFDLIISNPPWEDAPISELAAYALYDPGFQLLEALLSESQQYLHPNGRLLLAYGAKTAITQILSQAPQHGWQVEIADERNLETLPEVFLPGMLLILTPVEPKAARTR